jgi:hypothetical protein
MTTKKHNIIVIGCCAVIAIGISLYQWRNHDPQQVESRVYRVMNGWGYDILVNDALFIRQESIPVIKDHQPFQTEEAAKQAAQLVVHKLKLGHSPALTKSDLDKIPGVQTKNGQYRKHQ